MSISTVDHWELSIFTGGREIDVTSKAEPEVVVFGVETYVKIQDGLKVKYLKTNDALGFSITPITEEEMKQP